LNYKDVQSLDYVRGINQGENYFLYGFGYNNSYKGENSNFYMTSDGIPRNVLKYCLTCVNVTRHHYLYTSEAEEPEFRSHIYACDCVTSRGATPGNEGELESDMVRDALSC